MSRTVGRLQFQDHRSSVVSYVSSAIAAPVRTSMPRCWLPKTILTWTGFSIAEVRIIHFLVAVLREWGELQLRSQTATTTPVLDRRHASGKAPLLGGCSRRNGINITSPESCYRMNPHRILHAKCVPWEPNFVGAEKTAAMLAECTAEPLTFSDRFKLMSQGIAENDVHLTYLGTKSLLYRAARFRLRLFKLTTAKGGGVPCRQIRPARPEYPSSACFTKCLGGFPGVVES